MEARDAFAKLREQVKICMQNPDEMKAALNLINSTNLDYFNAEQKAELFRLKAETLQHLGKGDLSNHAYSAALSVRPCLEIRRSSHFPCADRMRPNMPKREQI